MGGFVQSKLANLFLIVITNECLSIIIIIFSSRLKKGRELERERDFKEVKRDLCLIRSVCAGDRRKEKVHVQEGEEEQSDQAMEDSEDEEAIAQEV